MIQLLRIDNFVLIDRVEISLDKGFTVITGETGSGKSILLNALNLLIGERADFSVIGPRSNKSIVEAVAQMEDRLIPFFTLNDLDVQKEVILRREIVKDGKSRAFINDTPVSLSLLKTLSSFLISIHSQYNTYELKSPSFQLDLLDDLANTKKLRDDFSIQFLEHKSKKKQLVDLQQQLLEQEKLKDYNTFLLEELGQLKLKDQDFSEIEKELLKLDNADNIRELGDSFQDICIDNGPYDQLYNLYAKIEKNKNLDQQFLEFANRLKSCLIELKELSEEGGKLSKDFDASPEVHRVLTAKIDAYNNQLNKHRFTSQEQLITLFDHLDAQLNENDQLENEILKLIDLIELEYTHLLQLGETLNSKRIKAIPEIEKELKALFDALKLKEATLNFSLIKGVELKENGLDQLSMLFSANKGMETVPIEKAASGGELSRVMLALQKMISEKRQLPSVLFDEIDTGVSGDVAEKIGVLLKEMGKNMQLIAISHLPQVAAKADYHLKVEKNNSGDKTNTTVLSLTNEQRVNEIARLMSGEIISNEALLTAKSLMN